MKYNKKGQGLIEFSLIGISVFCLSVVAVICLGPSIGNLFSNNKVVTVFSANRYNLEELAKDLITDITITVSGVEGIEIESPLESYLQDSIEETSGTVGDINMLIGVIHNYIDKLNEIVLALETIGADTTGIKSILEQYTAAIEKYESFNEAKVLEIDGKTYDLSGANSDLLSKVAEIELLISFNGTLTTELDKAKEDLFKQDAVDSSMETLIDAYVTDLIGLGDTMDYHVDSESLTNNSIIPSEISEQLTITTTSSQIATDTVEFDYDDISNWTDIFDNITDEEDLGSDDNPLAFYEFSYDYDTGLAEIYPSSFTTDEGTTVNIIPVVDTNAGTVKFQFAEVDTTGTTSVCIKNCEEDITFEEYAALYENEDGYCPDDYDDYNKEPEYEESESTEEVLYTTYSQALPSKLVPIDDNQDTDKSGNTDNAESLLTILAELGSGDYDEAEQEAVLKEVTVYQGEDYTTAAANTYNDAALCTSLGGTVVGGNCECTND